MAAITSIFDLEQAAQRKLPKLVFDYAHGGAEQQLTLQRNLDDLRALLLHQHVLRDVSRRQLGVAMLGERASMPLAIAPMGLLGLTWPNGEVEAARAAAEFGVPFCLSTMSVCSIEDVAQATGKPFWFQLYMMKQRSVNESLMRRAREAACPVLVLTLDLHAQGQRWADARNGLSVPLRPSWTNVAQLCRRPRWLLRMLRSKRWTFGNLEGESGGVRQAAGLAQWVAQQFDPGFDADTVRWVRKQWDGELLLKGIMQVDDARQALALGADGIIVSNHGGRQLDGAPSSISALPHIADAVGHHLEVYFDGGIRTGSDIVKALGLGARACLSGRACLYGLAANGREGVLCALRLLHGSMDNCMTLMGLDDAARVPRGLVTP